MEVVGLAFREMSRNASSALTRTALRKAAAMNKTSVEEREVVDEVKYMVKFRFNFVG